MSRGRVYWFTGLSGAGKSTIAQGVKRWLEKEKKKVILLDGDTIRSKSNKHLSFSSKDILENNAFITRLCLQCQSQYDYILVSVISPYLQSRQEARRMIGRNYYEVFVQASLDEVIKRDVKGMYKKALKGEIKNFIGFDPDTPYEPPKHPEITLDTEAEDASKSIQKVIDFMVQEEEAQKYDHNPA